MLPIKFEGQNCVYAERQPEYLPLPAFSTPDGIVTSIWKPTDKERKAIADGANIALSLCTNHQPLQPIIMAVAHNKEIV